MIPLNTALGIAVFLVGMALVSSIITNLCTQRLLEKCKHLLVFAFFMLERKAECKKEETAEPIKREGTE